MRIRRFLPRMSYRNILISITIVSVTLAIGDRLALEWTGGDAIEQRPGRSQIPVGKPGFTITSIFWLVSARALIVSLNISFYTVMWVFPNTLEELAPGWMEMNVRETNRNMHRFAGIWMNGLAAVAHTLLLFLPPMVDGVPLVFRYDGFDWSQWWDPVVKSFGSFISEDVVYATLDEFWRILGMILIFGVMLPISRSKFLLSRSYSLSMAIHAVAGFGFMLDMVRKSSHPLCWYFNLPLITLYIWDRLYATFLYRTHQSSIYKLQKCSSDSFIAYIHVPNLTLDQQGCGDNFWLLHQFSCSCYPVFQRAHPFTAFQNHDQTTRHLWNVALAVRANPADRNSWTLWLMCRDNEIVFARRKPSNLATISPMKNKLIGIRHISEGTINPAFQSDEHFNSSTRKSLDISSASNNTSYYFMAGPRMEDSGDYCGDLGLVRSWGPYRSTFYAIKKYTGEEELLLIAGGTGFAFILSAISVIGTKFRSYEAAIVDQPLPIKVFYTAREARLLKGFCSLVATMQNHEKILFSLHYTGHETLAEDIADTKKPSVIGVGRGSLDEFCERSAKPANKAQIYACASTTFLSEVALSAKKFRIPYKFEYI